jgi:ketosteroid isomerase-like protein
MTQTTESLAIIKALYAGMASGDVPAILGSMSPDIAWTEAEGFPYGGTYHGPQAIVDNVFMKLATEWDGFAAVPDSFVAQDGAVVALGLYSGTYKATGKSFRAPFAHSWTIAGGKVVKFHQYTDTAIVQRALAKG